jgi:uncharacterized protein with LGFP repeats
LTIGCVALLAPATSSAAVPEATDFAQPLGGFERSADADGHKSYRSQVLEAPARFDLAGLAGEKREAEFRGRVQGGAWTDWAETANGDPVWFGGMDELQVRTHGWRPTGRVHYVSVTGEGVQTAERRGGMPNVISRQQWGANQENGGCKPRKDPDYGKVKAAAVHHTVSATNYSESQAPGMILAICRFHRNGNGWDDVGYNAFVDRFGNIYEGRAGGLSRAVVGAHAQGVNAQTTGVAALGTHSSTPVSRAAMNGLAKWLAWKLPEHGLDGTGRARMVSAGGETARYPQGDRFRTLRIFGHRVTNFTACPGDALFGQLSKLRKKVIRRIDGGGGGGGGGGIG